MAKHWSQHQPTPPCNFPVYRDGREARCGARSEPQKGFYHHRCTEHKDTRTLAQRTLDPLGPYHNEVHKIQTRIWKEKKA